MSSGLMVWLYRSVRDAVRAAIGVNEEKGAAELKVAG